MCNEKENLTFCDDLEVIEELSIEVMIVVLVKVKIFIYFLVGELRLGVGAF